MRRRDFMTLLGGVTAAWPFAARDLFFVVSGLGEIRYKGKDGAHAVPMPARAFCAMPPGYEHEVCNLSATEPFSFLLIHAPWQGYDHVRTHEKTSAS